MTEKIEGVLTSIMRWSNGKGGDVTLTDDDIKYYYEGKLDLKPFLGRACELEVSDGSGERKKQKEILNCKEQVVNPSRQMPEVPNVPLTGGRRMIQLPFDDFQAMMSQKLSISDAKRLSLDAAVKTYAAMGKVEKDPKAAADEVTTIAEILEGFLV